MSKLQHSEARCSMGGGGVGGDSGDCGCRGKEFMQNHNSHG